MRLLYVVQRYGAEVAGGAERHCREFATRLASRGHDVEVVTTRARSYVDWADEYPEGTDEIDGVAVHRLPVTRPRHRDRFNEFNGRVLSSPTVPRYLQEEWMRLQGPFVGGLEPWLRRESGRFDRVIFFTYLYFTTWAGLRGLPAGTVSVLHPTAHDEPPLYLPLFDDVFAAPSGFALSTPEEEALLRRRFAFEQPADVIGIGTDLDVAGDASRFRERFGLGDRPYVLYVGRLDAGKASAEMLDYFAAYKDRNPGPLTLVAVGEHVEISEPPPDVVVTGFVDEQTKHDAYAGALALVHPSYYESFAMVVAEAWAFGLPALVQGRCEVLDGQVRRGRGGLPYSGFAEFETALQWLAEDADLRARLGQQGRDHATATFEWGTVLDRYEAFLAALDRSPTS